MEKNEKLNALFDRILEIQDEFQLLSVMGDIDNYAKTGDSIGAAVLHVAIMARSNQMALLKMGDALQMLEIQAQAQYERPDQDEIH